MTGIYFELKFGGSINESVSLPRVSLVRPAPTESPRIGR